MTLLLRSQKGIPLTHSELDENLKTLYSGSLLIEEGEDNSVIILDSDGRLKSDEINSKVWDNTLISGSGTLNRVSRWSNTDTLTTSNIVDNGNIGINTTDPQADLHVVGTISGSNISTNTITGSIQSTYIDVSGSIKVVGYSELSGYLRTYESSSAVYTYNHSFFDHTDFASEEVGYDDGFSAIHYLGNGMVIAGRRNWKNPSGDSEYPYTYPFVKSTDYGKTWKTIRASNITGSIDSPHIYEFQHDETGKIFVGTGDVGAAELLVSEDWGETWDFALSGSQVQALATGSVTSIFTTLYLGGGEWVVPVKNNSAPTGSTDDIYLIKSVDSGSTWTPLPTTGLSGSFRNVIQVDNDPTHLLGSVSFVNTPFNTGSWQGVYRSEDGGSTWTKGTPRFNAFEGLCDLGNGVYLVGTFDDNEGTSYYDPVSMTSSAAVTTAPSIYRSTDYGATWNNVYTVSDAVSSSVSYIRSIEKVDDNLIIAYVSCFEEARNDRDARQLQSRDNGLTWIDFGNPYTGPSGSLNGVYGAVEVKPGNWILAGQPDGLILNSIYNTDLPIKNNIKVEGTSNFYDTVSITGSINVTDMLHITRRESTPTSVREGTIISSGSEGASKLYYYNGTTWNALF